MSLLSQHADSLIEERTPVYILYIEELGDPAYAVTTSPNKEWGFFLDIFFTKEAARRFCRKYKLPVVRVYDKGERQ